LLLDAATMQWQEIRLEKNQQCSLCS
jgi:hypothetical protein